MAKDSGPVNQHKRMAMGEKVTGMKKGGKVDAPMKDEAPAITKKVAKVSMKKKGK